MSARQVFLLSPANCSGKRAGFLLGREARSELSLRLRSEEGAPIGEVFSFISGLYFRGKLAYATRFQSPPQGTPGTLVIAPGRGLLAPTEPIDVGDLSAMARVPVDPANLDYTTPLHADATRLSDGLGPGDVAVLLGSIATRKYLEPLGDAVGGHLRVPREFVGMGEMRRGSLLLRRAADGTELTYVEAP